MPLIIVLLPPGYWPVYCCVASGAPAAELAYFGEASEPCGNCDNCLNPPATWDATEAARKLLSCIYRFHQRGDGVPTRKPVELPESTRRQMTQRVQQHIFGSMA